MPLPVAPLGTHTVYVLVDRIARCSPVGANAAFLQYPKRQYPLDGADQRHQLAEPAGARPSFTRCSTSRCRSLHGRDARLCLLLTATLSDYVERC